MYADNETEIVFIKKNLPEVDIRQIAEYTKALNKNRWLGRPPETWLCSESKAEIGPDKKWRVLFIFCYKSDGWQPKMRNEKRARSLFWRSIWRLTDFGLWEKIQVFAVKDFNNLELTEHDWLKPENDLVTEKQIHKAFYEDN